MIIKKDDSALVNCYSSTTIVIITFLLLAECSECQQRRWSRAFHKELQEVEWSLRQGGVDGIIRHYSVRQEEWTKMPLEIAVTGSTGVGKSSFINAVRRVSADDEGAAPVGVTETTETIESYIHPQEPHLKFWDLPGLGTARFPKHRYLQDIEADRFDFFLLITASRFTENDLWLAGQLRDIGKQFFFIRNKIGMDLENDKRAHPQSHNEETVVNRIRADIRQQLHFNGHGHTDDQFVIDTFQVDKWDFSDVEEELLTNFPNLKRVAMIRPFREAAEEAIRSEARQIRNEINGLALMSGLVGAIPLPGISAAADFALIVEKFNDCKKRFNLEDESLLKYARLTSTSYAELKSIVDTTLGAGFFTAEGVKELLKHYAGQYIIQGAARFIPFVGSLIAAPFSAVTTHYTLNSALDKMESVSIRIIHHVIQ